MPAWLSTISTGTRPAIPKYRLDLHKSAREYFLDIPAPLQGSAKEAKDRSAYNSTNLTTHSRYGTGVVF